MSRLAVLRIIDHTRRQSYSLGTITALEHTTFRERLEHSLESAGFRFTRQRREVFQVVADSRDHPTADEIFERVKRRMPEISFATVYNCLSVLVRCGLLRQVTLDRSPTRFCPNMREHCHFFCESCGQVTDIEVPSRTALAGVSLPHGFEIATFDISLRGVCPHCAENRLKR
jgi:Fe2+ or Zn2+ uptake regulation protein